MGTSALALTGFIAWTILLLIVMELVRTQLVLSKKVMATEFTPDNANLSPFMQRLTRAHANCLEGLPVFGGLLMVAVITSNSSITDPLAMWLLLARVVQSSIHLLSTNVMAVNIRFACFAAQVIIAGIWCFKLITLGLS